MPLSAVVNRCATQKREAAHAGAKECACELVPSLRDSLHSPHFSPHLRAGLSHTVPVGTEMPRFGTAFSPAIEFSRAL